MEIVTAFPPDIQTADEAREYIVRLRQVLLYLGVCDGKMEEGSMRCEPNISVRVAGSEKYGTKTELKNLGSFTSVQLGVEYESKRQIEAIENGETILQETRGWNEQTEISFLMRVKESEADYRYFPDPDLVPMQFTEEYIERLRATIPELPVARLIRYQKELGLSEYDANILISVPQWSDFFEACIKLGGDPKTICNWMNGDFARKLKDTGEGVGEEGREETKITPAHLVELTKLIDEGTISGKSAKDIFNESFDTGKMPKTIVEEKGLTQISDNSFIIKAVEEVLNDNPGPVEQFLSGKEGVIGFLVGQVMKKTQGRANPPMVQQEVRRQLSEKQ